MIQRIQTLFLLMASVFMLLLLTLRLATFLCADKLFELNVMGVVAPHGTTLEGNHNTIWLIALVVISLVMPLIIVFLYKNRALQLKLSVVLMVILAALQGAVIYRILAVEELFASIAQSTGTVSSVSYSVVALMPLIAMILLWLAMRGIRKDEKLVRSLDRIR